MRYMSSTTVIKISLFVRDDFPDYPLPLCAVCGILCMYVMYTHTLYCMFLLLLQISARRHRFFFFFFFFLLLLLFLMSKSCW
jgi:hypothetical protein